MVTPIELRHIENRLPRPLVNSLVGFRANGTAYLKPDADGVEYNIDAVLADNEGFTDADALQWCIDRTEYDDDNNPLATPRSIVVTGTRKYNFDGTAYNQTTSPNGGTTTGANAKILLPAIGEIDAKPFITITFRGPVRPTKSYSVVDTGNTNVMGIDGLIFECTDTAANTQPCIFGVSQSVNGYGSGTKYFSLIHVIFENCTVRGTDEAPLTAVDLRHAIMTTTDGLSIDTGTTSNAISDPSSSTAGYGLRLPQDFNGAWTDLSDTFVQGYKYGVEMTEHAHVNTIYINYCVEGLTYVQASHASYVERCLLQWNKYHVTFSGGPHNLIIQQLDFEGYDGSGLGTQWYQTVSVVKDTSHYGHGTIRFVCGIFSDSQQITNLSGPVLDGGAYLTVTRHQPWKRWHNTASILNGTSSFTSYSDGNGSTIYYQSPAANGDITRHEFWCMQGIYLLSMAGQVGPDAGIIDVKVTDASGTYTVATIDLYASGYIFCKAQLVPLMVRYSGRQYLSFTVNGKNASSSGYNVQFSFVQLLHAAGD